MPISVSNARWLLLPCLTLWVACSERAPPAVPPVPKQPAQVQQRLNERFAAPAPVAAPPPPQPVDPNTRHASCKRPLKAARPRDAQLSLDAGSMNAFQTLSCDKVPALPRCDANTPCPYHAMCVVAVDGEKGYCVEGDGAPLGFRHGACETQATAVERAALCCAKVPGVDCEPWPRAQQAGPGQVCVADSGCEPGLVCVPAPPYGHGRCGCPGAEAVENPASCGTHSQPPFWGSNPKALAVGACEAASAPGFVLEVLGKSEQVRWGEPRLSVGLDGDGLVFAAFATGTHAEVFSNGELAIAPLTRQPDVLGMHHYRFALERSAKAASEWEAPFSWWMSADGKPQFAVRAGTQNSLRTLAGEAERTRTFPAPRGADNLKLHVLPDGRRIIAGDDSAEGAWVAVESGKNFDFTFVPFEGGQTMLEAVVAWPPGQARVIYSEAGQNGAIYDPLTKAVTRLRTPEPVSDDPMLPSVAEPFAAAAHGEDLYVAQSIWAVDPYRKVALEHLHPDGTRKRELLWSPGGRTGAEVARGSVAIDAAGKPHVFALLPAGITWLHRDDSGSWQATVLSPERGVPHAIFTRDGKLEVYYRTLTRELRRVRQGSCPQKT